ncbi:MAG: hypothetical protein JTT11_08595 [Candidatus Brockarchaeota archaeon]|nr:hypothetical protein [Candidatus Brockarchaeota archaeon]
MAQKRETKESYARFLLLSYSLLVIAAGSAVFAYFASAQNEPSFALAYLVLSLASVILFVLVRLFIGPRIRSANAKK